VNDLQDDCAIKTVHMFFGLRDLNPSPLDLKPAALPIKLAIKVCNYPFTRKPLAVRGRLGNSLVRKAT
jgi:hypothetical protein